MEPTEDSKKHCCTEAQLEAGQLKSSSFISVHPREAKQNKSKTTKGICGSRSVHPSAACVSKQGTRCRHMRVGHGNETEFPEKALQGMLWCFRIRK